MMSEPRAAVFLSSTAEDLAAYRKVVIHVAQRLGLDMIAMEDFGPDPRKAVDVCREKVEQADIFVGLYAHRYGFIPDGFNGRSVTELEYRWAVDQNPNLPILVFMVDDDMPWPASLIDHGSDWERLQAFKRELRGRHVIDRLETPEKLRDDLFVHLPRHQPSLRQTGPARPSRRGRIPEPPSPYVAHQYSLLHTNQVIGRQKELDTLDAWVRGEGREPFSEARFLCLVALGGMGKSALVWKWFHDRVGMSSDFSGRLWWSFYESEAGFDNFVTTALAYVTNRTVDDVARLPVHEQRDELLSVLDEEAHLVILDGLERILIAYATLDFAHMDDQDLDERTDNTVTDPIRTPLDPPDTVAGTRRLRKTIDPRVGEFLRRLTRVRNSRILATTRLFPSDLQTATGAVVRGCDAWFLRGLAPRDALALWRAMGVSGADRALDRVFATVEYYPLLIRALAGEVAVYRHAPGDFDAWRTAHPDFDPFTLPLIQAKTHVLAHSLSGLHRREVELLSTLAAFRAPIEYATVSALFCKRQGWRTRDLDNVLTQLEDRGLLGWDRSANRYDLHPIVRGVVMHNLDRTSRNAVYGALESHFSAFPTAPEGVSTREEAASVIELINALIGLGRHADAGKLYYDRLHRGAFHFADHGMRHVQIALLEGLFAQGLDQPPSVSDYLMPFVLSQLSWAYGDAGRLVDAYEMSRRQLSVTKSTAEAHSHVAVCALDLGRLRTAMEHATIAVSSLEDNPRHVARLALCEGIVGLPESALARLAQQTRTASYDPRRPEMRIQLWLKRYDDVLFTAQRLLATVERDEPRLPTRLFLAEALVGLGRVKPAIPILLDVLREARAMNEMKVELQAMCGLANAYRVQGDYVRCRTCLVDVAEPVRRGPYRLIAADAANILARMELARRNDAAAMKAAKNARRLAFCDGPTFAYYWALHEAEAMLGLLTA
jgi:tetratricopeptide (TPR) repeat protein